MPEKERIMNSRTQGPVLIQNRPNSQTLSPFRRSYTEETLQCSVFGLCRAFVWDFRALGLAGCRIWGSTGPPKEPLPRQVPIQSKPGFGPIQGDGARCGSIQEISGEEACMVVTCRDFSRPAGLSFENLAQLRTELE